MLNPEKMEKVTIIGPRSVMDRAVKELHNLKIVHVTDHQKGELDIGSPFESADDISLILVSVRAISAALKISGKKELTNGFSAVGVKNIAELGRSVKKLNDEVNSTISARNECGDELKKLGVKETQLSCLNQLGLSPAAFSGYKSLAHFIGAVSDVPSLQKSLSALNGRFELFSAGQTGSNIMALFIDAEKKAEAAELLSRFRFLELSLAEVKDVTGSAQAALDAVIKRKAKLEKHVESCDKSLSALGRKWNDFLLLSEQLLTAELEKAEAPLRFGVSKNAFVINGWVPAKERGNLESHLSKATGERIYVESEPPKHKDSVPVLMKNPVPARPFEFLMRLYSLPHYDEIDPTVFNFITFPLFFGFILGDVGYGLVTFFLLLWLRKKMPGTANFMNLLMPAAASSIIFGFLFGEVFGFEQAFGFEFPRLIERAHDINGMIIISVIIGLVHINLGFVLGFFNELGHKGFLRAFGAKFGYVLFEFSAALVALSASHKIPLPIYIGIAVMVVCLGLIVFGEGLKIVEIFGLPSNALSYARLAAVGLSSVILATVFNDMAAGMARSGPLGMVFALIILFVGHTLNLALGLLGSFLHSLRLHYVEFFTKFFEGGSIPFKPFGLKN